MPPRATTLTDEIGIALGNLADAATAPFAPTLRLGVTGLSRSGKTVFITSLVHNLLTGGQLPGFSALTEGRFIGARLAQYPDDAMPRFAYEAHLKALTGADPHWPESTSRISQLRLELKFQSQKLLRGMAGPATLNLDIVDYPGEWLLDLPLLSLSYAAWSTQALERARRAHSAAEAAPFLAALGEVDGTEEATDARAKALAESFTDYLRASREDGRALSSLPPGRFLLPGDLEGSPALTFAPMPPPAGSARSGSLYALMQRRYDAYKQVVVRPFFRDHFARLDRQVVLVDTLRALNAGPAAVADLETALTEILACFRQGDNNPLTRLVARKIDRILFAATKADHIHSSSHDRLEAVMSRLVAGAAGRAKFAGAQTRSMAIAGIRATRDGVVKQNGDTHEVIVGTPMAGQKLGDVTYDGKTEVALFPGDLPKDPERLFEGGDPIGLNFLRFVPPKKLARNGEGHVVLPHVRMDGALDYLIGDRLR
ncbi:YcjX family protein [Devosia sp.]|uniref:YcjX family protein n=1 Tax=Devosia sp. TaxID=1871048 RepID=UPI003A8DA96F